MNKEVIEEVKIDLYSYQQKIMRSKVGDLTFQVAVSKFSMLKEKLLEVKDLDQDIQNIIKQIEQELEIRGA